MDKYFEKKLGIWVTNLIYQQVHQMQILKLHREYFEKFTPIDAKYISEATLNEIREVNLALYGYNAKNFFGLQCCWQKKGFESKIYRKINFRYDLRCIKFHQQAWHYESRKFIHTEFDDFMCYPLSVRYFFSSGRNSLTGYQSRELTENHKQDNFQHWYEWFNNNNQTR